MAALIISFQLFASIRVNSLSNVERKIEDLSKRYLEIVNNKHIYENDLVLLRMQVETFEKDIINQKKDLSKIVQGVLLGKIEKNTDLKGVASEKILLDNLKNRVERYDKFLKNIAILENDIKKQESELGEFEKGEVSILGLINELEATKSKLASSKRVSKFHHPVSDFKQISSGSKGVTYKLEHSTNIKAPATGKVVYVGGLSTYGNLIMIEHSGKMHSVLLGDFLSSVQKGQQVRNGDTVAISNIGEIYFELRRNNRAQKTINLIEKVNI